MLDSAAERAYPHTLVLPFDVWPDKEGVTVEFRLVYRGRLPAQSSTESRVKEKHAIRRVLHAQLRNLWNTHPFIARYTEQLEPVYRRRQMSYLGTTVTYLQEMDTSPMMRTIAARIGHKYERCGYQFVPLIGGAFGAGTETVCALDILFLRRDPPGRGLVVSGGDIDNRLKVLFDALRMPENRDELRGAPPGEDERPFFCLLENDNLITEVRVTTDHLLTPLASDENINDVELVMHVKSMAIGREFADIGLTAEEWEGWQKLAEFNKRQREELEEYRRQSGEDERFRRANEAVFGPPPDEEKDPTDD